MNKKVFLVLGGILLLILITLGFILYLTKKSSPQTALQTTQQSTTTTSNTDSNGTGSTGAGTGTGTGTNSGNTAGTGTGAGSGTNTTPAQSTDQPQKISDDQVVAPVLSFQNSEVWYFINSGKLYKLNLTSGLKQEYLLPSALKIDDAIWSTQGGDFIAVTNGATGKVFNYYNSQSKTYTTYPEQVKEVAFMPQGNQIIYQWTNDNGTSQLSIANPDLTAHKTITNLTDPDDIINISPIGNKILLYKNAALGDGKIYYISLDNFKVVTIKSGPYNKVLWSNDGEKFVFDKLVSSNSSSQSLWLGDIVTAKDTPLNFKTDTSKMVFNSTGATMYYAVPAADGSGDDFWSYDVASGTQKQIFASTAAMNISASDLLLNNDSSKLYFKNGDGLLYSINLN